MTKLATRLFHHKHEEAVVATTPARVPAMSAAATAPTATTAPPLTGVSRWAIAPSGVCDICNTSLDGAHGRRVPAAQFTRAVQRGYNPFASGRASSDFARLMGLADPYPGWREIALGAAGATDWALCDACAEDLSGYIASH